jgi:hypothetical protein
MPQRIVIVDVVNIDRALVSGLPYGRPMPATEFVALR